MTWILQCIFLNPLSILPYYSLGGGKARKASWWIQTDANEEA